MVACKKEEPATSTCGQAFYYYQNTRIYLDKSPDYLTVGFTDSVSQEEIVTMLQAYPAIVAPEKTTVSLSPRVAVIGIKGSKNCQDINALIAALEVNPKVTFASHMFESGGSLMGETGEFMVQLKDSTHISDLRALADATGSILLKKNEFRPEIYVLAANKNSARKSVEMANYFFETGKFQFAEPNFIIVTE
jgi:hypothetical protein